MLIFEKWFGGDDKKEEGEAEKESQYKFEFSPKQLAECVNKFIASRGRVKVGEEFVEAVITESGLVQADVNFMFNSVYNHSMMDNGLSVSDNLAEGDRLRDRIIKAVQKMDVGNMVE